MKAETKREEGCVDLVICELVKEKKERRKEWCVICEV